MILITLLGLTACPTPEETCWTHYEGPISEPAWHWRPGDDCAAHSAVPIDTCTVGPNPCPDNEWDDNPNVLIARSDGTCIVIEDCPAAFDDDPDVGEEWLPYAVGCYAPPPPPCPGDPAVPAVR